MGNTSAGVGFEEGDLAVTGKRQVRTAREGHDGRRPILWQRTAETAADEATRSQRRRDGGQAALTEERNWTSLKGAGR